MARLAIAPPAAPVIETPWRPQAFGLVIIAAAIIGITGGLVFSTFFPRGELARYEYHLWRWQADTLLDNVFSRAGIGPHPKGDDATRSLTEYFRLTSALRAALDDDSPDLALIDTLTNERATYENDVERLVEARIHEAVEGAGLTRGLPLFRDVRFVWPPVDFELTNPPRLLVRSPRDRIARAGDTLLKNDLSLRDIEQIERETDSGDTVSIVVSIGGIAAYPAIVRDDRSYESLIETASHEWVHHYLAFFPLGEQWGNGGDAETLNETTADLAGREIANLIRRAHPVELPRGADGTAPPANGRPVDIDFNAEMRRLRLEVDDLLAKGKVDEAEALMDARRRFFNDHGIPIRRINQAYFAFYGTYAASAASSNPIGPKVDQVWERTKDVGRFLAIMREVRTTADLDAALSRLPLPPKP